MTIFGYVPGDPILDFMDPVADTYVSTPAPSCEAKTISTDNTSGNIVKKQGCSRKPVCDLQASLYNQNFETGKTISLIDIIEFRYLTCASSASSKFPVLI